MTLSALFIFILLTGCINGEDDLSGHVPHQDATCNVSMNACNIKMDTVPQVILEKLAEKIPRGPPGPRGYPGFDGLPGIHGLPGEPGICPETCKTKYIGVPPDTIKIDNSNLGTSENPAEMLCNVVLDDNKLSGNTWVNRRDKFQVHCNKETKMTCLIKSPKNTDYYRMNAFEYNDKRKPFWLSNYNNKGNVFKFQDLYGVSMKQIAWLQDKSVMVTQKIRYHCKNSFIYKEPNLSLQMLSWNDVIIEDRPTDTSPIFYDISKGFADSCNNETSKDSWGYTDIIIRGSTNRLPVIDFFIRDTRNEDQSFAIELLELCFA